MTRKTTSTTVRMTGSNGTDHGIDQKRGVEASSVLPRAVWIWTGATDRARVWPNVTFHDLPMLA